MFRYNPDSQPPIDPPEVIINPTIDLKDDPDSERYNDGLYDPSDLITTGNIQILDLEGEIKEGMIELSPDLAIIDFNYLGGVENTNFKIVVSPAGVTNPEKSQQCVIVQTLLGAMRTAEGDDCL